MYFSGYYPIRQMGFLPQELRRNRVWVKFLDYLLIIHM